MWESQICMQLGSTYNYIQLSLFHIIINNTELQYMTRYIVDVITMQELHIPNRAEHFFKIVCWIMAGQKQRQISKNYTNPTWQNKNPFTKAKSLKYTWLVTVPRRCHITLNWVSLSIKMISSLENRRILKYYFSYSSKVFLLHNSIKTNSGTFLYDGFIYYKTSFTKIILKAYKWKYYNINTNGIIWKGKCLYLLWNFEIFLGHLCPLIFEN
jgi:hypothetical protein